MEGHRQFKAISANGSKLNMKIKSKSNHDIIEYYLFTAIYTDSLILINHSNKT